MDIKEQRSSLRKTKKRIETDMRRADRGRTNLKKKGAKLGNSKRIAGPKAQAVQGRKKASPTSGQRNRGDATAGATGAGSAIEHTRGEGSRPGDRVGTGNRRSPRSSDFPIEPGGGLDQNRQNLIALIQLWYDNGAPGTSDDQFISVGNLLEMNGGRR